MISHVFLSTLAIMLSLSAYPQSGNPIMTTFRVDGLIISKSKFDSLKLSRAEIVKIRSLSPAEASKTFGPRAANGVGIITTSKMFILNGKTAIDAREKEAMLANVGKNQIKSMRNIDARTLLAEFRLEHPQGAIVLVLRE